MILSARFAVYRKMKWGSLRKSVRKKRSGSSNFHEVKNRMGRTKNLD